MTSSPPPARPEFRYPFALTDAEIGVLDHDELEAALHAARAQHQAVDAAFHGKAAELAITYRVLAVLIEGLVERDGGDRVTVPLNAVEMGPDIMAWFDQQHEVYVLRTTREADHPLDLGDEKNPAAGGPDAAGSPG